MPLEIRELIIKASVGDEKGSPSTKDNSGSVSDESTINEIVEKVLSIIKEKSER